MKARRKGSTEPFKELHQIRIGRTVMEFEDLPIEDAEFEKQESTSDHWQDVRERAAIAAMQGYMSCKCQLVGTINLAMAEGIAEQAILIADVLVKKLKGE